MRRMKHVILFLGILSAIVAGTVAVAYAASCSVPYKDAAATDLVQPDYPADAKDLGIGNVTVLVEVTIAPSGKVQSASVFKSSRNSEIDREALRVAKESKYAPKVINCHPIQGSYVIAVIFNAD